MTDRFRRNGARAWLLRVLGAFALALVLALALFAAVAAGAAGDAARPSQLLSGFTGLSLVLNLVILAAFAVGTLLTLGWLSRAAREEAAVNRFHADNEERFGRRAEPSELSLEGLGRCAVRERVQLVAELRRSGTNADLSVLSEALLDREEPRVSVARYTAGTLVLLGLLGTFVGLLLTIGGVADVVDGLGVTPDGDLEAFLVQLKVGLRSPLEGMALAFSTSLLGLAGSLLLGIGALGLSAAQSSWISKLEETTVLYLAPGSAGAGSGAPASAAAVSAAPAVASSEALKHAEAAAALFRQVQAAAGENAARMDSSAQRMGAAAEDLRDRVAALAGQVERVETALARVADGSRGQAETLNDLGVKLAGLVGAQGALKAELRDGNEALGGRLQAGFESLRQGQADGQAEMAQQGAARLAEARRLAELLERLVRAAEGS